MTKFALIAVAIMMLTGCGQTIVLMPDLDGSVGQITVTAQTGEQVTLNEANQALKGKDEVTTLSDEQITATFSEALEAQPIPTARFLLYFLSDSTKMKAESKELIPSILQSYRIRSSTDVSVIGHTDRVGDKQYNYDLSMRRALKIKALLEEAGIPTEILNTDSHGEENPLIPTADGKREPKNRRVEVLVR